MNFAEASGYLQNPGREKAWEAVCIGFDSPHQEEEYSNSQLTQSWM